MAFFSCDTYVVLLLLPLVLASANGGDKAEFTYSEESGKGPNNWGSINPNWTLCGNGKLQSPIDLIDNTVQKLPILGQLKKDHHPASAVLKSTGHDVQVKWLGNAGKIQINGTDYNLVQMHWHSPSEHTINGQRFDLELHAVHKSCKEEIAVIGVLYKYGQPDPLLSQFLPKIKSTEQGEVQLGFIDPNDIQFDSTEYYRYIGSLTTPPCCQGVLWTVVKKVKTVSQEQVATLKGAVHHGFEENARPTQQLNGRPVWFYNARSEGGR